MKPDWDKLGDAYADSTSVLVADVDCTSDGGKDVCEKNDVSGYPTIKYFTAETGKNGKSYEGGRDYEQLEEFVKETLARKCDTKTKADCDDREKKYIDKWTPSTNKEAELVRLDSQKDGDMQPESRQWIMKRIALLKGMLGKQEL